MRRRTKHFAVVWLIAACATLEARAQDLEPRSYSASPVGMSFVAVQYSHPSGDEYRG